MANYTYVDSTGIIVPDTSELQSQVVSEWQAAFPNIDTSNHTPQGTMIAAEVLNREAVVNNNALVANQINPNVAGGVWLDALCALLGLQRSPAQSSTVNVRLTGTTGTVIPANTQFRSVAGDIWYLPQSAILANGLPFWPGGIVWVDLKSLETGQIACPDGELTEVYTPVLGLETVYNPNPASLGSAEEGDIALGARRRVTLARQSVSSAESQVSALWNVAGVTGVAYRENTSGSTQTIDGINMAGHSIWACVDGGTNADVATALWRTKTAGAAFNGSTASVITDPYSGQTMSVLFDRPDIIPCQVTVTGHGTGAENVPGAIVNYAAGLIPGDAGLGVGVDVSLFELAGAINYYVPQYYVTSIELKKNGTAVSGNITIALNERASIAIDEITVNEG